MSCLRSRAASGCISLRMVFTYLVLVSLLAVVVPSADAQVVSSPTSAVAPQSAVPDVPTPSTSPVTPADVKAEVGRISGSIPVKREAEPDGGAMFGLPQLLLLVAVLGGLLWWLPKYLRSRSSSGGGLQPGVLSRMVGQRQGDQARVISSSRLAGKATLHVVEWNHEQWLLGCTEHQVSVLAKRPIDANTASSASSVSGDSHA
ncbi:hypothetical protein CO705_07380 [Ralstonia pickettii]|nr:hypothetical protein CO705_07380 [Ralstonia pickettii]